MYDFSMDNKQSYLILFYINDIMCEANIIYKKTLNAFVGSIFVSC